MMDLLETSLEKNLVQCKFLGGYHMIRVLICDDDWTIAQGINDFTETALQNLKIEYKINVYHNPEDISDTILKSCDLVLLDVDLRNDTYNGIDLARRLRKFRSDAVIIFITNFIEYAPEGYEVRAFRYVLKNSLESSLSEYIPAAIKELQRTQEVFKFQIEGEIVDIPIVNILYLEVQQHDITLYFKRGSSGTDIKKYVFHESLSNLGAQLEEHGFLRIHKSYLVNMRYIKKFQCREALLYNGIVLRVSEKNYADNKKKFLLWKGCVQS